MNFSKKITLAVLTSLLSLSFYSCSNDDSVNENSSNVDSKQETNDFVYSLDKKEKGSLNLLDDKGSSNQEEYDLTVTDVKTGKSLTTYLIKQNKNNTSYNLLHYDHNKELLATLVIVDSNITDVILANELPEGVAAKNCFTSGYKQFKENFSQGDWREVTCDVTNIFMGACTVAGVVSGAINCVL